MTLKDNLGKKKVPNYWKIKRPFLEVSSKEKSRSREGRERSVSRSPEKKIHVRKIYTTFPRSRPRQYNGFFLGRQPCFLSL